MNRHISFYLLLLLLLSACTSKLNFVSYQAVSLPINSDSLKIASSDISKIILPYQKELHKEMDKVLGETDQTLIKAMPDASLGNFVADVCIDFAEKSIGKSVDFCVLNTGGIRIPSIQKGAITVGKIFELMPFDNNIEVVELSGEKCEELFLWIAKWRGAPVSRLSLTISTDTFSNVFINGVQFDKSKKYLVATTDFMVNGGDKATMFAGNSVFKTNIKLRDAILNYVTNNKQINGNRSARVKQY